jgi:hypothetical protein
MRSERKDMSAYRGTMKMIRTMYLCVFSGHSQLAASGNLRCVSDHGYEHENMRDTRLEHRPCIMLQVHNNLQQQHNKRCQA